MLNKLSDLLLDENTPAVPNILDVYQINESEIITGVQCPFCYQIPMARKYGTWFCTYCHKKNALTQKQAFQDYLLLHHSITNEECRQFLHITSPQLATRLLSEANLPYTGSRTARVYHLKIKD
jgi:ribosomal protein L37AE/L43A